MNIFKLKKEHGQAIVEFALVLPIVLLLIGGIIDFGWIFHNKITANNACREASRYVAIHYYYPSGEIVGDINNAKTKATSIISGTFPTVTEADVNVTKSPDDAVSGEKITVNFTVDIDILTPILSTILGEDQFSISSECTMRIEK